MGGTQHLDEVVLVLGALHFVHCLLHLSRRHGAFTVSACTGQSLLGVSSVALMNRRAKSRGFTPW